MRGGRLPSKIEAMIVIVVLLIFPIVLSEENLYSKITQLTVDQIIIPILMLFGLSI